jgi:alpha-galactosidase
MPIHASDTGWILETRNTGYAFGPNRAGALIHRYWGARLPYPADYPAPHDSHGWASFNNPLQLVPEEYPGYENMKFVEPCLKVTFADGVRDVVLRFQSAEVVDDARLHVHLRDTAYPLAVTLVYRVHDEYDLIERSVVATNQGDAPITVERIWSAQWHLPHGDDYRMTYVSGRWLDEFHLRRETLLPGLKVLESRRLTTSHHHNSWFAIDRGDADEDTGGVWFGVLAWSGNWKMSAERDDFASTRLSIGLNDWDFAWRLPAGETFTAPSAYGGWSGEGFGGASRKLHDFVRDTIIPHGHAIHKVLYNSWEATTFHVDEAGQSELAEHAAAMGVELFVMDDGWFHGRDDDHAGLGDWWPDERKFPNGLQPLIRRVNELGMDFGLWVEPEMVNPNSELYRAHPDWVIHFPTRERTTGRDQLILNLARADVQEYLIGVLDRLLADHNITFIKWDMNRNVSEPGWPDAPGDQREIWVRYVQGLYHVWGTLRERHPDVIWQSCSGGGGRADFGILRLADQVWISDNTEPTARLAIQEGYSHIFPAHTMEAWVTDMGDPHLSLEFRFLVSMCGSLGVGGHLLHWGEAGRAEATRWIALYKEIRHIVQLGDQYRLRSPQASAFSAVQYVAKDGSESVVFTFRTHLPPPSNLPLIYLRGLVPDARYTVEQIEANPSERTIYEAMTRPDVEHAASPRSGASLMHAGIPVVLGDFSAMLHRVRRIEF